MRACTLVCMHCEYLRNQSIRMKNEHEMYQSFHINRTQAMVKREPTERARQRKRVQKTQNEMNERKRESKTGYRFLSREFLCRIPFFRLLRLKSTSSVITKCAQNHEIALKLNDIDLIGFFTHQNRIAYIYLISILLTNKNVRPGKIRCENVYNEEYVLNRSHM